MDVTNTTEKAEWDHPVQVTTALLSESVEGEFDGKTVRSAEVTFRPGERTKFHTHSGVQVLYVTEGEGIVATRDQERAVSKGDLIVFPPDEEHWHGNKTDTTSSFSHVYFLAESADGDMTVLESP